MKNKIYKFIGGIGIVVIVAIIGRQYLHTSVIQSPEQAKEALLGGSHQDGQTSNNATSGVQKKNGETKPLMTQDIVLQVEDLGVGTYGEPHQRIVLTVGGPQGWKRTIGEYFMNCLTGSYGEVRLPGEITRMKCWWAGAGELIVVTQEGGKFFVKQQSLDEQAGFGPIKTLFEIPDTSIH
jgi:hypothetical protein